MPSLAKSHEIAIVSAIWNIVRVGGAATQESIVDWLAEIMGEGAPSEDTVYRRLRSLLDKGVVSRKRESGRTYSYAIVSDRAIEYVLIEQSPASTYYDALNDMVDQGQLFRVGDKYCWNVKRWLSTPELHAALVFMARQSGRSLKEMIKDMKKPRTAAEFREYFS